VYSPLLQPRYRPHFQRPVFPQRQRFWLTSAHTLAVWVREDLVSLSGAVVASETDIQALIWHGTPSDLNVNPFEVITGITTDGAGHTDFQISNSGLALFDPITFLLIKAGSPDRFGVRTIIPSYE
jgi:hypothetical protein